MRRTLHTAAGLAAFALGLLVAGAAAHLPYALPAAAAAALLLPALWKRVRGPGFDAHRLKVASLTLLLWTPLLALFLPLIAPPYNGSCVVDLGDDYLPAPEAEWLEPLPPVPAEGAEEFAPCVPGALAFDAEDANLVWVGVIDGKVLSKPVPRYPPVARQANVSGTVAVSVVVDESGYVLGARPLAGHPLLRPAAARAACGARFSPTFVAGGPVRAVGLLTYRFGS